MSPATASSTTVHPKPLVLPSTPLPNPLPPAIRAATLNALLATQAIPTLQRTLRDECIAAGWFKAIRARALEIIQTPIDTHIENWDEDEGEETEGEGKEGNYDIEAIRALIIREALGKDRKRGEDGEYEDDGAGMMVRKKKRVKRSGEDEGRGKADVRLPERAIEAGTKVVRDALEKVVVIEGEKG